MLEIDVDDAKFREYTAAFDKYRDALANMPRAWQAHNMAVQAGKQNFVELAAALSAQVESLRRSVTATRDLNTHSRALTHSWSSLSRDAGNFARHLGSATRDLLRWTGITSALGGIIGVGGLFGIERMAQSVYSTGQRAGGLGVPIGGYEAFNIGMRRFLPQPNAFLSSIYGVQTNIGSHGWGALQQLGISWEEADRMTPQQLALRVLPAAQRFFRGVPRRLWGKYSSDLGFGELGLDPETITRLEAPGAGRDLQRAIARERQMAGQLGFGGQTRRWQDFLDKLDAAGNQIRDVFVVGLTPVLPQLTKLADGFAQMVVGIVRAPEFAENVKTLIDATAALARGLSDIVSFIHKNFPAAAAGEDTRAEKGTIGGAFAGGAIGGVLGGPLGMLAGGLIGALGGTYASIYGQGGPRTTIGTTGRLRPGTGDKLVVPLPSPPAAGGAAAGGSTASQIYQVLHARGWSDAAIQGALANARAESGLTPWGRVGSAGEQGLWQFNPASILPGYMREAGSNYASVAAQTSYMAALVERQMPGYARSTDAYAATDAFMAGFERPRNSARGSRYKFVGALPTQGGFFSSVGGWLGGLLGGTAQAHDLDTHPYQFWPGHAPPGVLFTKHGRPYSASLLHMTPTEHHNAQLTDESFRVAHARGQPAPWSRPDPGPQLSLGAEIARARRLHPELFNAAPGGHVNVTVNDNTGGSVNINTSQLPQ